MQSAPKASKKSTLADWMNQVLKEVEKTFPPQIRGLYRDEENLRHYRDLAIQLQDRFSDQVLAQSAFLHGIPCFSLSLLPAELVDGRARTVLEEREKLRSLDPRDHEVRDRLRAEVLPTIREARAVILFVLEQMHHLDPGGELQSWSRAFRHRPRPLPGSAESGPWFKKETEQQLTPQFIASVVEPVAEYFGLWRERHALEDTVAIHFSRARVERLIEYARSESEPGGACGRLRLTIEAELADHAVKVCWQWRHLGSLVRRLPPPLVQEVEHGKPSEPKTWERFLCRAGVLRIECDSVSTCYQVLGRLHGVFDHRPTEVKDFLHAEQKQGARRLETILVIPGAWAFADLDGEQLALTVHIQVGEDPERAVGKKELLAIQSRLAPADRRDLQVFAPDGQMKTLPPGATVLEFAAAVNHRWLVHLAGATVNRQPVGLLRPLAPGDVVWLKLQQEPTPLPKGWKDHVSSSKAQRRISREFRYFYRKALEDQGRDWLRQKVQGRGVERQPDDQHLDVLLEDAARLLGHFADSSDQLRSSALLRQLGLLAARRKGLDLPYRSTFSDSLAERLVERTVLEIQQAGLIEINDLELPSSLRAQVDRVELCPSCQPAFGKELVGTRNQRVLMLHQPKWSCAEGGQPVSRSRIIVRPQYFVLGARNRAGLGVEMLQVFAAHDVDLVEFVGIRETRQWAIARVRIDRVSQAKVDAILRDLKQIGGVERVEPPGSGDAPDWETPLPPRRDLGTRLWLQGAPYVCGNPISEDAYFYGMKRNRARLERLLRQCLLHPLGQGGTAFVHGPKRAGKTSLARLFLREVELRANKPCLTVYHAASIGQKWPVAEQRMLAELWRKARRLAKSLDKKLSRREPPDLLAAVTKVQTKLDCMVVLVVDEATTLFKGSTDIEDLRALSDFHARIQAQLRVVVLWVGPEAQVASLPQELESVLQQAESVKMQSLSSAEIKDLLSAAKFEGRFRIHVPNRVSNQIHRLTGGNPYWASLLGSLMWHRATEKRTGDTRYDIAAVRSAVEQLVSSHHYFMDRLVTPGFASRPNLVEELLVAMLPGCDDNQTSLWSGDALRQQLRGRQIRLTGSELRQLLHYLKEQGSVLDAPLDGRPSWQIAAPLLALHLRYKHGSDESADEVKN